MKALTVAPAEASLIAKGGKWVVNHLWWTPYRGPVAIHAASERVAGSYSDGEVIATARLVACVHLPDARRYGRGMEELGGHGITAEALFEHRYATGPWCWVLRDVQPLANPVPARGALGLWDWQPPDAPPC